MKCYRLPLEDVIPYVIFDLIIYIFDSVFWINGEFAGKLMAHRPYLQESLHIL